MNCEICQELIHDLIDGTISQRDESTLNTHLKECLDCESVRRDLASIIGLCQTQRGQYQAPPNEKAMWLRIRNVIEAEIPAKSAVKPESQRSFLGRLMGHTWELSLPQLAASAAAIVLFVSLTTVVGVRRWGGYPPVAVPPAEVETTNINDRVWQRQQVINYWNQRIELNKARWSLQTREKFDRANAQIDQAVAEALNELKQKPHDEVAEQMLNVWLNDKVQLLKDFSDL